MKKWSSQWTQFMQLRKEAWKKIQDFNGVWAHDLAIIGAMIYQLCYEATDIGSRSIVGSYFPVKEMSVVIAQLVEHRTGNHEVTGSNQWSTNRFSNCWSNLGSVMSRIAYSLSWIIHKFKSRNVFISCRILWDNKINELLPGIFSNLSSLFFL